MLRNVPTIISAELMKTMMEMGHGDEICFADANFPGYSNAKRVINADGHSIPELLDAVLRFFPLDEFVKSPVFLMEVMNGHDIKPTVWETYRKIISRYDVENAFNDFEFIERQMFYEQTKKCYAVVISGERALYGNIILKKGNYSRQNAELTFTRRHASSMTTLGNLTRCILNTRS